MKERKTRKTLVAAIAVALILGITGLSFAYNGGGHRGNGGSHRGGSYSHNGGCW